MKERATPAAAVLPIAQATDASKPKRDRKRKRDSGPTAVIAAEGAARRIDGLLSSVRDRATAIVEAQRKKPSRWQYFAALADLEERLRQVLAGKDEV